MVCVEGGVVELSWSMCVEGGVCVEGGDGVKLEYLWCVWREWV